MSIRAGNSPKVSIVVITHNEGCNLLSTVQSLHDTSEKNSEIVVVDDCSSDGSTDFLEDELSKRSQLTIRILYSKRRLGAARARNFGAARSSGEYIVFSDAHNTFPLGWQPSLVEVLEDPRIGAVAPAISDQDARDHKGFGLCLTGPDLEVDWLDRWGNEPYPVPLLPGGCLAMRRDIFETTGGFDEGLIRYGEEDCELSLRLWMLGFELLLVPTIEVAHLFKDKASYGMPWKTILHNRLRLAFLHLSAKRLVRVVQAYQDYRDFASALALIMESDISSRRADLRSRRVHNDDWLFQKFNWKW